MMDLGRIFDGVKVDKNGCWLWQRYLNSWGYGRTVLGSKSWLVHRLAYTLTNGVVPEGQYVLHRCDVRRCVNPEHLFLGTLADNAHDRDRKGRTQKGATHYRAKINGMQVLAIRASSKSDRKIAEDFGISPTQVRGIRAGKYWKHVKEAA